MKFKTYKESALDSGSIASHVSQPSLSTSAATMNSLPPSYKLDNPQAGASLSRSRASQDGIASLADELLRASLSHSNSPPSPPSTSTSVAPPSSYRMTPNTLFPPSTVRAGLRKDDQEKSRLTSYPSNASPPSPHTSSSRTHVRDSTSSSIHDSPSRVSAAEAKARVHQLQFEMDRVRANLPRRTTEGLFKTACSTDLLFLIDTTKSMRPYIAAAKIQVRSIVDDIKAEFLHESDVRVAVVGYVDHCASPNIRFLDFTPSVDEVHRFLDDLNVMSGGDVPEDVLGGIRQALNASWKQQTRCIIHIGDAPPHGRVLHDLKDKQDHYPEPGSEPHGLTYEPLIKQLVKLKINYTLLRINSSTDRMILAFSQIYGAAGADVMFFESNAYCNHMDAPKVASTERSASYALQFAELQLGTTYSELQHLVIKSVTGSVIRTTNRLTMSPSDRTKDGDTTGGKTSQLTTINKDQGSDGKARAVVLETVPPQWDSPGWLDETLIVEGFCPDVVVHDASTLNDMMDADKNIKLSIVELTINARSRPFAQGAVRIASYARTVASTSKFVVKRFLDGGKGRAHLAEDMRIQALCKAFALEFNGLLRPQDPIDFVVATCLQSKRGRALEEVCLSLEPFLEGEYVKYNSNSLFVRQDSADDPLNRKAQAFSHFTFERSCGHFLVTDLQGVGNLLTDPSIQTLDHKRFNLNNTNLHEVGFKFFFVGHECNDICRKLELQSNREMVVSGDYKFREWWPTMDSTVCCSNKLCRKIVRLASARKAAKYPGYHWCDACFPQLESSLVCWMCVAPGPDHDFEVSRFFHESQAQAAPRRCPEHLEKDRTVSNAAVVGGSMWSRMKAANKKSYISGSSW